MEWKKELHKYLLVNEVIPWELVNEWKKLPLSNIQELLTVFYEAQRFDSDFYKKNNIIRYDFTESLAKFILALAADKGEKGIEYIFELMRKDPFERKCPFSDKEIEQLHIIRFIVEDKEINELFKNMMLNAEESMKHYIMIFLEDGSGNLDISRVKSELIYEIDLKRVMDKLNLSSDEEVADDDPIYEAIQNWYDEDKDYYILDMLDRIPKKRWNWNLAQKYICACNNSRRYNDAVKYLNEYEEYRYKDSYWHFLYAYTLYMLNKEEEVIKECELSISLNPDDKRPKELRQRIINWLAEQEKKKHKKKPKRKKVVIKYSSEDDKYYVSSGVFDLGYMGCYEAEKIKVEINEYEEDENYRAITNSNLKPAQIAKKLSEYYAERQNDLLENQKEVNNAFLDYLMDDILGCDFPFWEDKDGNLESFIIKNRMPKNYENVYEKYYEISRAFGGYYNSPNNGTIEDKLDTEEMIKEYFPMISVKKLIETIEPEYLVFDGSKISFQCSSDVCDGILICAAYAVINKDNSFWDWHNR